jgi:hypothetical protein
VRPFRALSQDLISTGFAAPRGSCVEESGQRAGEKRETKNQGTLVYILIMDMFKKRPEPAEMVRKWKRELRREERAIERNIRSIETEERKVERK